MRDTPCVLPISMRNGERSRSTRGSEIYPREKRREETPQGIWVVTPFKIMIVCGNVARPVFPSELVGPSLTRFNRGEEHHG